MKLHRFYVGADTELSQTMWVRNSALLHQWGRVLRYRVSDELVLFDGIRHDRLYRILGIDKEQVHLELITQLERTLPHQNIYLAWSLLKKDKNDWVLQKATELGVNHFLPILADRSEKTGFNVERARKIIIEASEQCGRSNIPSIREPVHVETLYGELDDSAHWLVAEQGSPSYDNLLATDRPGVVLVGPEGGWTEAEKVFFAEKNMTHVHLSPFTLRAETAAIIAVSLLGRLS
ncbi:16S rRNA (uracil(1498)-N(3))-methyltransferase [soil metagenome]